MPCRVAIIGGGPSGLFLAKALLEANLENLTLDIFEKSSRLGPGMPYSSIGAKAEHVTNVSGNEIPELVDSLKDWLARRRTAATQDAHFKIDELVDYRVLPRLLFGDYLNEQFSLLLGNAKRQGIPIHCHLNTTVTDVIWNPADNSYRVEVSGAESLIYDCVIIATGHNWPRAHERKLTGYFDSPYPPAKLEKIKCKSIALKGSSLTAFDAIRTLARNHGAFVSTANGMLKFNAATKDFKIVMHSLHGMLPAIRFHLEDPHLSKTHLLERDELKRHQAANGGFISLDFLFEKDFKDVFKTKDPQFYDFIKPLSLEEFVEAMLEHRNQSEPFAVFKEEYAEATKSIEQRKSILWKEKLAVLSFALNYPAKHFSAEDMLRMKSVLMPLISVVIAFAPQSSSEEVIALHDAGHLDLIQVDEASHVEPRPESGVIYHYKDQAGQAVAMEFENFIDCTGQPHLSLEDFPFNSLLREHAISQARVKFKSPEQGALHLAEDAKHVRQETDGSYSLKVPGLSINDDFAAINGAGEIQRGLYIMAVPYIGGFNPDYSGLDFCEEASKRIVQSMVKSFGSSPRQNADKKVG